MSYTFSKDEYSLKLGLNQVKVKLDHIFESIKRNTGCERDLINYLFISSLNDLKALSDQHQYFWQSYNRETAPNIKKYGYINNSSLLKLTTDFKFPKKMLPLYTEGYCYITEVIIDNIEHRTEFYIVQRNDNFMRYLSETFEKGAVPINYVPIPGAIFFILLNNVVFRVVRNGKDFSSGPYIFHLIDTGTTISFPNIESIGPKFLIPAMNMPANAIRCRLYNEFGNIQQSVPKLIRDKNETNLLKFKICGVLNESYLVELHDVNEKYPFEYFPPNSRNEECNFIQMYIPAAPSETFANGYVAWNVQTPIGYKNTKSFDDCNYSKIMSNKELDIQSLPEERSVDFNGDERGNRAILNEITALSSENISIEEQITEVEQLVSDCPVADDKEFLNDIINIPKENGIDDEQASVAAQSVADCPVADNREILNSTTDILIENSIDDEQTAAVAQWVSDCQRQLPKQLEESAQIPTHSNLPTAVNNNNNYFSKEFSLKIHEVINTRKYELINLRPNKKNETQTLHDDSLGQDGKNSHAGNNHVSNNTELVKNPAPAEVIHKSDIEGKLATHQTVMNLSHLDYDSEDDLFMSSSDEDGYTALIGTDDTRICPHYRSDTKNCFKGPLCKLEHVPKQQDGWTTDKIIRSWDFDDLQFPLPEIGAKINIEIIEFNSIEDFYGRIVIKGQKDFDKCIDEFHDEILHLERNKQLIKFEWSRPPISSELVFAYSSGEQKWYRGRIIDCYADKCDVAFLDTGRNCITPLRDLRAWDSFMEYAPFQAVKFRLAGIKPISDLYVDWFKERMNGNIFAANVVDNTAEGFIYINLFMDGTDIAKDLICRGHGIYVETYPPCYNMIN